MVSVLINLIPIGRCLLREGIRCLVSMSQVVKIQYDKIINELKYRLGKLGKLGHHL